MRNPISSCVLSLFFFFSFFFFCVHRQVAVGNVLILFVLVLILARGFVNYIIYIDQYLFYFYSIFIFTNMKSILALIAAAVLPAAAQSIPPQQFGLPISTNNTVLSVAFNQAAGQAVVVQPGQLFGKQSKFLIHKYPLNLFSLALCFSYF